MRAMAGSTRQWVSEASSARSDRKSTRLNSSHLVISYAVFCLKKKNNRKITITSYHRPHVSDKWILETATPDPQLYRTLPGHRLLKAMRAQHPDLPTTNTPAQC